VTITAAQRAAAKPLPIFKPFLRHAIRESRKTMTRRVIVPQPPHSCWYVINGNQSHALCLANGYGGIIHVPPTTRSIDHRLPCPYGAPGEIRYLREPLAKQGDLTTYADDRAVVPYDVSGPWKWQRPLLTSIHMPARFARTFVRLVSVRVERLQEINNFDALAEGVLHILGGGYYGHPGAKARHGPREAFADLWDWINADRGYSWQANPWVWVIAWESI
jgi:hypothetical protein